MTPWFIILAAFGFVLSLFWCFIAIALNVSEDYTWTIWITPAIGFMCGLLWDIKELDRRP